MFDTIYAPISPFLFLSPPTMNRIYIYIAFVTIVTVVRFFVCVLVLQMWIFNLFSKKFALLVK